MSNELSVAPQPGDAPRLRGLFIGINRTASPWITDLSAAVRDADALHALFEDNLEGVNIKLVDEAATRDRLAQALDELTRTSTTNDVVVITFSGHGTDTHELVTYDADPLDFARSCMSLTELTERISAIDAKHLLVVLDCCFSGGAGAKVLRAALTPRGGRGGGLLSAEALLEQMAGTGRLILTASTADQPAYENPVMGHGLLTYHLLHALLGPEGVIKDGRVPIYGLLSYVTTQVIATASGTYAARQDPTLRGQIDGAITWPPFRPGPLFHKLFPEKSTKPVTSDLRSLESHGIAEVVVERWSTSLPSLNELQQSVVNNAGLLDGKNVLVTAPTSSGKTMLGELAALNASQRGGRSVFLLPTRALVNEQYERFAGTYSDLGYRVVRVTGEISDQLPEFMLGQFDIALLTYEKFAGLALGTPHVLRLVSVVVIDEVQNLVTDGRGDTLELLLTAIKSRREDGITPQIVCLSAVLGDLRGLDSWLDAQTVRWTERPVDLVEGILTPNGRFRYVENGEEKQEQLLRPTYGARARDFLVPLVRKLAAEGQQVIVFRNSKGSARGSAAYLAGALGLPPATEAIDALPTGDPSVIAADLRNCLRGGVAFHVSDLERDEKRVVEDHFRRPDSHIRVIVSTTTLAQGVNLPAETVIVTELAHPQGLRKTKPYTVAEYKNIAGRAGRLGLTEAGRAIVLAFGAAEQHQKWQQYVLGTPEDVRSCLLRHNVDLYTLLLQVVSVASTRADGTGITTHDAVAVLSNTLASHQMRLEGAADPFEHQVVIDALDELRTQGFIVEAPDQTLAMSSLGRLVARSGIAVKSAITVTRTLRSLTTDELNRATLIVVAQLTEEVEQVQFPLNYKGYRAEMSTFGPELQRQRVAGAAMTALQRAAPGQQHIAAKRAKKAVACLLWTTGIPAASFEPALMKHMKDRDAIGPVRAVTSRTRDVIDTVIAIAREAHPEAELDALAELLPVQLELGVPANIVWLARTAGAAIPRQAYLNLSNRELTSPDAIHAATDEVLMECVGDRQEAIHSLRAWAEQSLQVTDDVPSLDDLLGLPVD